VKKIFYNHKTNHTIEDFSASKNINEFGDDYQEILIDESKEYYKIVNDKLIKNSLVELKKEETKARKEEDLIQAETRRVAIENLKKQGKL